MTEFTLSEEEISTLKIANRAFKKRRDACRINANVLLGTGWAIRKIAEVLLNDDHKGYSGKLSKSERVLR